MGSGALLSWKTGVGVVIRPGMGVEELARVTAVVDMGLAILLDDAVAYTEAGEVGPALAGTEDGGVLVQAGPITGIVE